MSLIAISGRAAYLPGANNLGVIRTGDGGAIAVDTGLDKDSARLLRRGLEAAGLELRAIVSTHHHADHVGGNAALLRAYPEARVYAPPLEAAIIENPQLEPIYLSMGARPPAALRGRWLMAPGSPVHGQLGELAGILARRSWRVELAGVELELIGLPGHSPAQIGVCVDGVCFAADGYFGAAVVAKHGVPYGHDVADQLAALDSLAARDEAFFLPGHGGLSGRAELGAELEVNRAAIGRALEATRAAIATPGDLAEVTARVLQQLGHSLAGPPQYAIFCGAVAAHLGELERQGYARLDLAGDRLLWSRAG